MSQTENKEHVQLQAGKKVPALTGVKWVKGEEALLGEKLTVLIFFNEGAEYYSVTSAMTEMAKKYKKKVSVAGLSSMNEENMNYFLSGTEETIQYGVGTVSEKLYESYMTGIDDPAYAFVIDSEKHLLWNGDFQSMDTALAVLFKKKDEKILLELGKKRQRILELDSEIQGKISQHLDKKKEIKSLLSDYLDAFAGDDDTVENLSFAYESWTPGETADVLDDIDWIVEKTDYPNPYTLIVFWDLESAPSVMPYSVIEKIGENHGDILNIAAVAKKAESKKEIKEYLESEGIGTEYATGVISAKKFETFFSEGTAYNDYIFLLDRENRLLWMGNAETANTVLLYIKNNAKKAGERLLEFQSDNEIFSSLSDSLNAGTEELTAKTLSKIRKYGKKILEVNPEELNVILSVLDFSGRLGLEELKKSFAEIDVSRMGPICIMDAVAGISNLSEDIYPFEEAFGWLETAVKKDQRAESYSSYGSVLAKAGLTQMALDYFDKALEISSGADLAAETGRKEMLRILEGQKSARKPSQTLKQ